MLKISGIIREMKWSFKFQESVPIITHAKSTGFLLGEAFQAKMNNEGLVSLWRRSMTFHKHPYSAFTVLLPKITMAFSLK